jgi:predicted nuclease with TOPRIM domain
MRFTTECLTCGGGTGQTHPCTCAVTRSKDRVNEMVERLRAQVEKLETKCALLAASWKKAEDRVGELEATVRDLADPVPLTNEQYRRMVDAIVAKPKTSR